MTPVMKNYLILLFFCILGSSSLSAVSSLAKNDPYPVYSAVYDPYLTTWLKEWLIGCNEICDCDELWALSVSFFDQKARSGRTFAHEKALLGDLNGRWNMLGLLYGGIPTGRTLIGTQLGEAKLRIFSDLMQSLLANPTDPVPQSFEDTIISLNNELSESFVLTDSAAFIGFFSVPIHYRKIGARFEFSIQPTPDFGLTIQGGVAEIRQTVTALIDLTPFVPAQNQGSVSNNQGFPAGCPPTLCPGQPFGNNFFRNIPVLQGNSVYTNCNTCDPQICASEDETTSSTCTNPYIEIENQLMSSCRAAQIFRELGLDPCNFEKTSFEDLRFLFWWRHIYEINRDRCCWPYFLLTPSLEFNFVIPTAKSKDRCQLYSVPFGNDGHWSVGFDAGISIDFVETVEIAAYGGINYFAPRNISNYRVPTDTCQSGIFPFATDVRVSPGLNFNWNIVFNAYHFIDRLSAYAEYILVKHETDDIDLRNLDLIPTNTTLAAATPECANRLLPTPFLPDRAECITKFTSQFVNAALYYEISPNITLGFLAQFPVAQRNAYRSTTYMGTFRVVF